MVKEFTSIEDYPKRMAEWLRRADVVFEYDEIKDKLYILSKNEEKALTNSERYQICRYLGMYKHAFKYVSFRRRD